MKKKTIDLLTTLVAILLFCFSLVAFWFDKMDGIMVIIVSVISVALIAFKNEKLENFINKIIDWKK